MRTTGCKTDDIARIDSLGELLDHRVSSSSVLFLEVYETGERHGGGLTRSERRAGNSDSIRSGCLQFETHWPMRSRYGPTTVGGFRAVTPNADLTSARNRTISIRLPRHSPPPRSASYGSFWSAKSPSRGSPMPFGQQRRHCIGLPECTSDKSFLRLGPPGSVGPAEREPVREGLETCMLTDAHGTSDRSSARGRPAAW